MVKKNLFSCFIVGDDNLTLQCAEITLAANHQVLGLISPSKHIKLWCATHSIPYINHIKEFETHYKDQPFDFLFSIVNGQILSSNILKLPRCYAINYHNSPLPRYAGLYATSWAILNGETHHAISWHKMEEIVDAGSILKQPSFPIEDEDTALTLNLKCYEHAVSSFRELVDELAASTIVLTPQNLSARSYYGLKNKPQHFGFISWEQPAEQIDRLCKALTFGPYINQLVTPKIIIHGEIFVVKSHKKLNTSSGLKPGRIVASSNECLQIATTTNDIALLKLTDLNGIYHPMNALVHRFGLTINTPLDPINGDFIVELGKSPAHSPKIEKFWVNEFLNCVPKTNFLSRLPKLGNSPRNHQPTTPIPKTLLKQINKFSKKPSVAKNALLTAALAYFYRLNNYKNLSVAFSHEALRATSPKLSQFLSDHVPLTTHFDSNMTFRQALQVVSDIHARLHQHKTFTKDLFIRYPELSNSVHAMDVSVVFMDKAHPTMCCADTPLTLYCFEDCSGFYIHHTAQDSSYVLSYAFLEQMNGHLLTLLDDAINNPDKKLFELSVLGPEEKNNLLVRWNNTQATFDTRKPLHHYFEEQVLKTPHAIAAVFEENSLTYNELNQKANILAHYLRNQGIQPNHLVGICLNRSLEMIVSILGILKSGGAYLPLDPNYPDDRITYMIQDSQCRWLLMDKESNRNKSQGYNTTILEISAILNQNVFFQENLECLNKPSDLAYVIYTSGTTGNPKGVAIPHKAICNHMLWMQDNYVFQESDVFLQKTPFSFDASVWEFFMPLFVGGKLIIAPNNTHASPKQLIKLVQKHRVSVLQLVPSLLKELVTTEGFHSCTSLHHVFCGGEALTPETINIFFKHNLSGAKLHNLYGPTETTIDAVTLTCTENDGAKDVSLIGQPIRNTQVYVLDNRRQLVPTGITGELYIAGEGLAQGYLNNLQATEEKFVTNPFSSNSQNRLYKTGDLVKWNAKGILEYHGRCDNQVKIRGYRIELNEVEYSIDKIPSIRQCIVVPESSPNGALSLSAYLVLNKKTHITASDIRIQLNKVLPDYMIPSRFFVVDHLLMTPGGKLDRKNIPTPVRQLGLKQQSREPHNVLEYELKNLWCSSLKIDCIGIDDDFFDLGGNSLSAMKIISFIKDKLCVHVTIRTLFEYPTIHTLAKAIERLQGTITVELSDYYQTHSPIVPIKEEGSKIPLFLIHPIGGSVFWYKNLGLYLDKERPLYGIQDPGLDKHNFLFKSLEEMASYYIDAMQTIQSTGPYLLGGASFGSTVAVEMAKQLQQQGETVTAILSLDGWAFYPSLQNDEVYFQNIMKEQNTRLLKNYIQHRIANAQFLLELQWHREQMLTQYKLPMIQTKFILFKAKELTEIFQYAADLNWWDNYSTKPIDLHIVPGNHESIFSEPNIQVLAAKMNRALNKHFFELSMLNNETGDFLLESM
ncbi:amino acid adenylation domain-containing protein [Legionella nagasakiensis]|uniref:amino acid adenylation domain-containing protein n=1 Tax=Legionella nagasakiensis TaxID=535290 RepID=UPI001054410C|nr:amino acid adenylation domain-containing protein [Legionella nagasakiensis]